jgi:alkanesulfonate monooxygenase SsuD/methylene tetrahydromethanopterin reductase-like flavin-dependent oxidoreductase (luciferase family)
MIPGVGADLVADWARRAEARSFASLATGELLTSQAWDPLVALTLAATSTERLNLLTNVLVLPLHNAGVLAKQVASLDVASAGRLRLGVGVGARKPVLDGRTGAAGGTSDLPDFDVAPAPTQGRYERFDAQIHYMQRIWRGEALTGALSVGPLPVQPGGPPLLIGGYAPELLKSAARWAQGLTAFGFAPDVKRIARDFALFREAWAAAGRSGAPELVASHFFALGPDAEAGTARYMERHYTHADAATRAQFQSAIHCKTAARLREIFAGLEAAGATEVIPVPMLPSLDQLDRLADTLGPLARTATDGAHSTP